MTRNFILNLLIILLISLIYIPTSRADSPLKFYKDKDIDFFPVPVWDTRPDEGNSYGIMPVVLFSDKESKAIESILAAIGQYNEIINFSGALIFFHYPDPVNNPDEVFEFYFEIAQKYYRELTLRYYNPKFLDKYYLNTKFLWLKTPFLRFYGYGDDSLKSNETNYTSRNFYLDLTFGYYLDFINSNLRANFTERFATTDLLTRAFTNVNDTLTTFAGNQGVADTTHFIHDFSLTFDNRPNGQNSTKGLLIDGHYFFSLGQLGSDTSFHGYSFETVYLKSFFKERTTTALRFFLKDVFGANTPFYLQPELGGDSELRSYIPNRFRDKSKFIISWEQRINVLNLNLFGIPVKFYADPFVEVGKVFDHWNNFDFDNLQPVGGIGFRAFVPPNVLGRLDIAVGKEGYSVYTMLDYPF